MDLSNDPTLEEEVERCKSLKEDLDERTGWEQKHTDSSSSYWRKEFPNSITQTKILGNVELPVPAKVFCEMLAAKNFETRLKSDTVFQLEMMKKLPDDGFITYYHVPLSWPISHRYFVLLSAPAKEIDWYGKKAILLSQRDGDVLFKPQNADGGIRVTNGGNFYLVTPIDEKSCSVFYLSNNN